MIYERFSELPALVDGGIVSKRPHSKLPIYVYNYTAKAQHTPRAEWTSAMCDCRGLILGQNGEIVARPFRKFWNYDQVLDQIPSEPFVVWEKLDGSLGIVASYAGERVVATRGSFESDQARWAVAYLDRYHKDFLPSDVAYLFEIVFPENRIVVDYGDTKEMFLLAVMADDGADLWNLFESCSRFKKAKRFDGLADFASISSINENQKFAGAEGFVVQWKSGFRAKVKLDEYVRLHRLITQCSTRTIWELLRNGGNTTEITERVPEEFSSWVNTQAVGLLTRKTLIELQVADEMLRSPRNGSRKDFAIWAVEQEFPNLLFLALDGKDTKDAIWKMIEPKWATPFRSEAE